MDHATFQQLAARQIQQWLQVFAALNDPAGRGLARDVDTVTTQYFFKAMKRYTVHVFGGQQLGQHAGSGDAFSINWASLSADTGAQYKIFTRLRDLLGNTKSTGSKTAILIFSLTSAARPSMDFRKSTGSGRGTLF